MSCISMGLPAGPPSMVKKERRSTPGISPARDRHWLMTVLTDSLGRSADEIISIHTSPQWPPISAGFQSRRGMYPVSE
jgi:hypothetical protein